MYYKACARYFPALHCITKLAKRTSQYYIVLLFLHKACPSATLYYRVCTKPYPVLLCVQGLHKARPSTTWSFKASLALGPKHYNVPGPCNVHATVTMHIPFSSTMCTFMQPLQCKLPWKNRLRVETSASATVPHTLHRRLQPLYTEKHKPSWKYLRRALYGAAVLRPAAMAA